MGDPRDLQIDGIPIGNSIKPPGIYDESGGSISIVIATDAPLTARQLNRMARRASVGLSRVGGMLSHGSGSFSIAFSNSKEKPNIDDAHMSILFRGVAEATEEAIINSMLRAQTISGRDDNIRHAIPIDQLQDIIDKYSKALKDL
jgi:D-aminopeptidase